MQSNLRLILWTVVGVVAIWFVTMTADLQLFLRTDVDPVVSDSMPLNRTDVGTRCGNEYAHSTELIYYKLNSSGQIVYLCPQGLSPIRSTVVAVTITPEFRRSLNPTQLAKVNAAYGTDTAPQAAFNPVSPAQSMSSGTPAPQTTQPMSATTPPPMNGSAPPAMNPPAAPVPVPAPTVTPQAAPQSTNPAPQPEPAPQPTVVPAPTTAPAAAPPS